MDEIAVDRDPPSIHNLSISPDTSASLLIALIAEIAVIGVEEEQHDLALFFSRVSAPCYRHTATTRTGNSGCIDLFIRCSDFPRAGFSLRADALRGQQDPSRSRYQRAK